MPITGLAIAAGIGLAKSELIDKPKEKRQRKLAAETIRLSPWTGMRPDAIQEADPIGTAAKYGVTGAMVGGGIGREQAVQAGKVSPYAPSPFATQVVSTPAATPVYLQPTDRLGPSLY